MSDVMYLDDTKDQIISTKRHGMYAFYLRTAIRVLQFYPITADYIIKIGALSE